MDSSRSAALLPLAAASLSGGLLALTEPGSVAGVLLTAIAAFEVLSLAALSLAMLRRRSPRAASGGTPDSAPAVSVVVAAWNERACIVDTVRRLLAQQGVALEVLVADDGSTDGTADLVEEAFRAEPRLAVLRLPHGGKGAALEAARKRARHPLVATVDADTDLEPGALATLVRAVGGDVVAAGGAVLVKDARGGLGRFQFLEYVRTTWVRSAWAELGMLEQLPGAFSVFDAAALERAGGFPVDSLTEDYEVGHRLYDEAARSGRRIHIAFVPEARAWTAPPDDLRGFVRQRTRWFAGFLSTWARFSHLVLSPRAGRFGLVRMPIKAIDAVAPLLLASGLLAAFASGAEAALALPLAVRAVTELALFVAADRLARAERHRPRFALGRLGELALAGVDGATYALFRGLVVLRAYPFALARVRTWERSRAALPEVASEPAPAE
jgi:cellulose synthase/poly-beta-1,6-N-acetylglucosamine synthase-like glycosyltransferase